MHIAPFDQVEGQTLTIDGVADKAGQAGLEFVILTPHLHPATWRDANKRRTWQRTWKQLAAQAAAITDVTVLPGAEYTEWGWGHLGIAGVDLANLTGPLLQGIADAGGFIVVNHPYAEPTNVPGVAISDRDLSFRPWTEAGARAAPRIDGIEVQNLPLGMANLIAPSPAGTGEERAFVRADAEARRTHQPLATVGGSDSHRPVMVPTTWVLAADARPATLLAALRRGATCVGGPAAGDFAARGDAEAADTWARIGDTVRAKAVVDLRWTGRGWLFIDGVRIGEFDGAYTHAITGGVHTYRLELGGSRCGFIYANL